jgi:hypothetical protein
MNDASPGFAKVQTEVASLLPNEGRSVSPAELVQHAGELSVWFTEEGLRGATAGELFEPPRVCRRPFRLSHAASFCSSSVA